MFASEFNAWVHLLASIVAIGLGFWLKISTQDWKWIILCIALVFSAEAINTAIEKLVDLLHPHQHPVAGKIKDLAAAAVLICAIGAAVIGLMILGPPFLERIS